MLNELVTAVRRFCRQLSCPSAADKESDPLLIGADDRDLVFRHEMAAGPRMIEVDQLGKQIPLPEDDNAHQGEGDNDNAEVRPYPIRLGILG
jgi:hypothetical protein